MNRLLSVAAAVLLWAAASASLFAQIPVTYPETPRVDTVDTYHGTEVPDPYRWLENLEADAVNDWVAAQNDVSGPYLDSLSMRDAFEERLSTLWNYERYDVPFRKGDRLFYFRNDGLQDQDVLYVDDTPDDDSDAPRVLIDPNTFRQDATVSLAVTSASPDGRYMAYGLSDGGTDWRIWRVRDVETGDDLGDEIRGGKFSIPVAWTPDEAGFYYMRYPKDENGEFDGQGQASLYYHRLGEAQADDERVFTPDESRLPYGEVMGDGNYLVITLYAGAGRNELLVKPLDEPDAAPIPVANTPDAEYTPVAMQDGVLSVFTTHNAPLGRVVAVDLDNPSPDAWTTRIPEADAPLASVAFVGNTYIAEYLEDAKSAVRTFAADGTPQGDVPLPGIGSVQGFPGEADDEETYFSFASFTTPRQIYRFDLTDRTTDLWRDADTAGFTPDDYRVTQEFYTSKDGTRVPMFIVQRAGATRDGDAPTLLYGYGGFDVSLTPSYSPQRMAWLEAGGTYVVANLRGGGEYGDAWHEAGMKLNKQNVFDDFIAAAEHLIERDYTRPDRLAIQGGSNGGLLVGAVITQRPDLFGAAHPAVGVLDMLRYHTASANARMWAGDYGLSENPKEFEAQLAYSPVHNVEPGTCYPPTLVTTAKRDDRVVPWHSYKFTAALQYAQDCDNPILLRVETRAGHGAGTPTWMQIEHAADEWSFLMNALGVEATP